MADPRPTPEEFMAQVRKEVAALPPGSDVAGFITRRCQEMNELLAQDLADTRHDASQEAGFPPSGMPSLRPPGDEEGKTPSREDPPSS